MKEDKKTIFEEFETVFEELSEVDRSFKQPKIQFIIFAIVGVLFLMQLSNPLVNGCLERANKEAKAIQTSAHLPNEVYTKRLITSVLLSIDIKGGKGEPKSLEEWHQLLFSNGWMLESNEALPGNLEEVYLIYYNNSDTLDFHYNTLEKKGYINLTCRLFR